MADDDVQAPPVAKPSLKQRLSELFRVYGSVAIATYLVISALAIIGFSVAIGISVEPSSAAGVFGVIGLGWAAAKTTVPIRILITLGLTPIIAQLMRRRRAPAEDPPEDPPVSDAEPS